MTTPKQNETLITFIPLAKVMEVTSWSSMTVWREEKAGRFPTRKKLSSNRVAWIKSEVDQWLAEKAAQ